MDTDYVGRPGALSYAPGFRRLTAPMLAAMGVVENHEIQVAIRPAKVLAAFKAAAPYMGLRMSVVQAVDWLFRFTDPKDWEPGSRPIVWPSAALQQADLGLGASQTKNLNRRLVELGLVAMRDSPNGKRYGRRDANGRILEAYGFDLSPLAARLHEFQCLAEAGREKRARVQALKRRASIARNTVRQVQSTAEEHQVHQDEDWLAWLAAFSGVSQRIAKLEADDLEFAVTRLEQLAALLRHYLQDRLNDSALTGETVDIGPSGPEKWPHMKNTNYPFNPSDTVPAQEGEGPEMGANKKPESDQMVKNSKASSPPASPIPQASRNHSRLSSASAGGVTASASGHERELRLSPRELPLLAPQLRAYLKTENPTWPDIVEAANHLRSDLGISQVGWGTACIAMGREMAAVSVAIISAKPANHCRNPGAYYAGMVKRARNGDLHLDKTIWGLRRQAELRRHGGRAC